MAFAKPPLSYNEQIELLKSRGLVIGDESTAELRLTHFNYYRLSAYRFSFLEPGDSHQFREGTLFEELWNLYCFDRSLRQLVNDATKRVEISTRSRWAYELAHECGPMAYEDPKNFARAEIHADTLGKIDEEISRSQEDFISHFRKKYGMKRPPIWAVCEIMSYGALSRMYALIRWDKIKKRISSTYNLPPDVLASLLHHLTYVRNLCAHHSRLWNRQFTITVKLPRSFPADLVASLHPSEDRRVYNTLVLLVQMLDTIETGNGWPRLWQAHAFECGSCRCQSTKRTIDAESLPSD